MAEGCVMLFYQPWFFPFRIEEMVHISNRHPLSPFLPKYLTPCIKFKITQADRKNRRAKVGVLSVNPRAFHPCQNLSRRNEYSQVPHLTFRSLRDLSLGDWDLTYSWIHKIPDAFVQEIPEPLGFMQSDRAGKGCHSGECEARSGIQGF